MSKNLIKTSKELTLKVSKEDKTAQLQANYRHTVLLGLLNRAKVLRIKVETLKIAVV